MLDSCGCKGASLRAERVKPAHTTYLQGTGRYQSDPRSDPAHALVEIHTVAEELGLRLVNAHHSDRKLTCNLRCYSIRRQKVADLSNTPSIADSDQCQSEPN